MRDVPEMCGSGSVRRTYPSLFPYLAHYPPMVIEVFGSNSISSPLCFPLDALAEGRNKMQKMSVEAKMREDNNFEE